MVIRLPTVIAVIILFLPVSPTNADSPSASEFYGCWQVSRINWQPKPEPGIAKYLAVPQRIFLSAKSAVRENTYILLPAPGEVKTIHDDNYWQFEPNGGIRLTWRAGAAGSGVQIILEPLVPGEKAMKGIAKAAFDRKVPQQDDPVVVYSLPCQK
jgi:hypothetical protein